jgi:hypothetical protein
LANGRIEEKVCFTSQPEQNFVYELVKSAVGNVSAIFKDRKITVFVPLRIAENWATSEEVGFEARHRIDDQTELKILVEKDFAFLKPKLEDDSDNYPHPLKSAVKI